MGRALISITSCFPNRELSNTLIQMLLNVITFKKLDLEGTAGDGKELAAGAGYLFPTPAAIEGGY